ncbi:MAG TPA: hypothetical protein VKZ18_24115 [Polyangia bacterium]|nr:hypothetical protein [Polyangia bacterium]
MSRLARLALTVALGLLPAVASAQMSPGPPTPLAVDLSKIALGSWAKYKTTMEAMPPMSTKMALVKRTPAGNTLEMSVEGGLVAKAGNVVTQMTLSPGESGDVKNLILQVGANDPMEVPIAGAQAHQFTKPDPKSLVKTETIKVAAGSFKTKHYHDKTPQGDTVDFWVSESVAPIGLVKMEMIQKSNPAVPGQIDMELTAVGKGAKTAITKPAKPFDQATLGKQVMGGASAPGAGAAPPAGK